MSILNKKPDKDISERIDLWQQIQSQRLSENTFYDAWFISEVFGIKASHHFVLNSSPKAIDNLVKNSQKRLVYIPSQKLFLIQKLDETPLAFKQRAADFQSLLEPMHSDLILFTQFTTSKIRAHMRDTLLHIDRIAFEGSLNLYYPEGSGFTFYPKTVIEQMLVAKSIKVLPPVKHIHIDGTSGLGKQALQSKSIFVQNMENYNLYTHQRVNQDTQNLLAKERILLFPTNYTLEQQNQEYKEILGKIKKLENRFKAVQLAEANVGNTPEVQKALLEVAKAEVLVAKRAKTLAAATAEHDAALQELRNKLKQLDSIRFRTKIKIEAQVSELTDSDAAMGL